MSALAVQSGSQYTDEQRREVIAVYAVSGNQTDVSKRLGIPRITVQNWVVSEWGQTLIKEIRQQNSDLMVAGYTNIVKAAIERTQEGLERGDYIGMDADGEPLYRPVGAKDAMVIAGIATDKRQILLHQPTSITATDGALVRISEQLAAYAKDKREKVIESHTVDT